MNKESELKRIDLIPFVITNVCCSNTLINAMKITYFISYNISTSEISILKLVLSASIFLLEIPTGLIADKKGNKVSLIIGVICFLFHGVFYLIAPNFWGFVLTQFLLGLSATMFSGALDSYSYSYFSEVHNRDYLYVEGKVGLYAQVVMAVLALVSSSLFSLNHYAPFYLTLMLGLITLICIIRLPNVESKKEILNPNNMIKDIVNAFKTLVKAPNIFFIVIGVSMLYALIIFNFEYYQYFYLKLQIPTYLYGVFYAACMLLTGLGYRAAAYLTRKFNLIKLIIYFNVIIAGTFILLGSNLNIYILLVSIILQQLVSSVILVTIKAVLLKESPEEIRATVISCFSTVLNAIRSFIMLPIVFLLIYFEIEKVYIGLGMVLLGISTCFLYYILRNKVK